MSSRAQATDHDSTPPARQAAPPRTEQLIETHKAWIAAAAGAHSRYARRRPRYLRPLAISSGIVAAALLLVSLGRGGETPSGTLDLAGELIPTVGADVASRTAPKRAARAFRGSGSEETGRRRGGRRAAERTEEPEAGPPAAAPAERQDEAPRLPDSAPSLATAPGAAPQVVADARAAAAPAPAAPRAAEAQVPRTASAVPEAQDH